MENVKILPYKVPRYQKNAFLGHFRLLHGIICLHIPTTSSLAVSLRGQPSFYGHRFTRYEFCDFFPLPGLFPANRPSPVAPVFSDSRRVVESVSEEKMNLYGSALGG